MRAGPRRPVPQGHPPAPRFGSPFTFRNTAWLKVRAAREGERPGKIEASAGELSELEKAAGDVAEQRKLARSALAGLSERMEGPKRRMGAIVVAG